MSAFHKILPVFVAGATLLVGRATARPTLEAHRAGPEAVASHNNETVGPVGAAPLATVHSGVTGKPYSGASIDVLTFHYDNDRTGWNASETDLTPATVGSKKFGLLSTLKVNGAVHAQPLLISKFMMPNGVARDVLIVATAANYVYAFDAKTYVTLWTRALGAPQSSTDVGCSDDRPTYGVMSTPVIIRSAPGAATIYLVAATEPSALEFHHFLHALDLASGADISPATEIAPTATLSDGSTLAFDPRNQFTRPALAYANGSIYVSIGAHCDALPTRISGWVLRYGPSLALLASFHTTNLPWLVKVSPGIRSASVWMSGFAPAIDDLGDIWLATGNGHVDQASLNFGNSVLKLSPDLPTAPVDLFTPPNSKYINARDIEIGSGGVMLIPTRLAPSFPNIALIMGKDPIIYMIDQSLGFTPVIASYRLPAAAQSQNGAWGGPAYYNGPSGPEIYIQANSDVLRAFALSANSPNITPGPTGATLAGYGGSEPVVTSNGALPGTGVVWVVRRSKPVQLEAYDAALLGAPIYTASIAYLHGFFTPLAVNGRVFVGGLSAVLVFGLAS